MFVKTVIKQGEKIVELDKINKQLEKKKSELEWKNFNTNRECLNLIGRLDEIQEEFLHILEGVEKILTSNSYGRDDIVISKAVAEIRYQKDIIIKDLEINNELANDNQSEN